MLPAATLCMIILRTVPTALPQGGPARPGKVTCVQATRPWETRGRGPAWSLGSRICISPPLHSQRQPLVWSRCCFRSHAAWIHGLECLCSLPQVGWWWRGRGVVGPNQPWKREQAVTSSTNALPCPLAQKWCLRYLGTPRATETGLISSWVPEVFLRSRDA